MKRAALEKKVRALVESVGFDVVSVTVKNDELKLPFVDVYVRGGGKVDFERYRKLEPEFRRELRAVVRLGWYTREIGYSDIPKDQAMIEVDCFPPDVKVED